MVLVRPMVLVRLYLRAVDGLCRWAAYASAAILAALFVLGFVEIISRKLFNYSIPIALEYSQYMLAILMFGGSAWALREGGHIRVTLLFQALGPKARRGVDFGATFFAFAIAVFLARSFIGFTVVTYQRGSLSYFPSETPLAWPQTAMAFGITLISFALAARLIRLVIGEQTESEAAGASLENLEIEGLRIEDPVAEIAREGSEAAPDPGRTSPEPGKVTP